MVCQFFFEGTRWTVPGGDVWFASHFSREQGGQYRTVPGDDSL
jgi:hypothetical protein